MLCSSVTKRMWWLLIPTMLYFVTFAFAIIDVCIDFTPEKLVYLLTERLFLLLLKLPPLLLPVYVSSFRLGHFENMVSQEGLREISDYLVHAPTKWMLTETTALDLPFLLKFTVIASCMTAVNYFVEINQEALSQPWDPRYKHFGSCTDGIRSGLEQHIDCGAPESGCPQTCEEKYGEYILIPADRKCSQVDGYTHITTQRACTVAYNSWSHSNKMSTGPLTRVYLDVGWEDSKYSCYGRPTDEVSSNIYTSSYYDDGLSPCDDPNLIRDHVEWAANWTDTFNCGAFSMPQTVAAVTGNVLDSPVGIANDQRVSFPAMFSSGHLGKKRMERYYERPIAHLCYAGPGCQTGGNVDGALFHEKMPCSDLRNNRDILPSSNSNSSNRYNRLSWKSISGPLPIVETSMKDSRDKIHVVEEEVSANGDCVKIRVDNSKDMGAQVVFTLTCDARHRADQENNSGDTNGRLACPVNNPVQVSVESESQPGTFTRSALLVFRTEDMTNGMRYGLKSNLQYVEVYPDSTLVLVVDQRSELESVKLCF